MKDLNEVTALIDQAAASEGDRYEQLCTAHDALREALVHTDGHTQAAGR